MAEYSVRETALTLLLRIEKEGGFSHLIISDAIKRNQFDPRDEKLLTEIVYGTIERKITLDFYLHPFIHKSKELQDWVRILLRLSVFQYVYLDKVPLYAIIHEAVSIAKKRGHKGVASLVNGILRNVDRQGLPGSNEIENPTERLAVESSHPVWLVQRWTDYYGFLVTEAICHANNTKKPVSIRVNRLKTNPKDMIALLEKENIVSKPSPLIKDAIIIEKGNILKTNYVQDGFVTIQDQSSMLAVQALGARQGMKVLDTCSAPGGKATYIGELMENHGSVHAFDLHQNKINLIRKNAKRLGLTNITARQQDARQLGQLYETGSFDRILIDAPCSGFGVIRSKPDIKYTKQAQDIEQLQAIQLAILHHVCQLLKVDGKMVYSTCTIEKCENDDVVKHFLKEHPAFQLDDTFLQEMNKFAANTVQGDYGVQIFPQSFHSDGFFITRIKRLF